MDHPEIVRRNANLRHNQLMDDAKSYRLARVVSGNNPSFMPVFIKKSNRPGQVKVKFALMRR